MRILKTSIAIAVILFAWFEPARAQVTSSAVSFEMATAGLLLNI